MRERRGKEGRVGEEWGVRQRNGVLVLPMNPQSQFSHHPLLPGPQHSLLQHLADCPRAVGVLVGARRELPGQRHAPHVQGNLERILQHHDHSNWFWMGKKGMLLHAVWVYM